MFLNFAKGRGSRIRPGRWPRISLYIYPFAATTLASVSPLPVTCCFLFPFQASHFSLLCLLLLYARLASPRLASRNPMGDRDPNQRFDPFIAWDSAFTALKSSFFFFFTGFLGVFGVWIFNGDGRGCRELRKPGRGGFFSRPSTEAASSAATT